MDDAAPLDLVPCGVLLLEADGGIRSTNRYFRDLSGWDAADLHGTVKFATLFSAASRIFIHTRLQPDLTLAGRVEELALDLVRPDGSRVPVMLNATQDVGADGAPGLIRVALWSAAAKRAYEAEVPNARRAAAAALQVKADFLANVSHELRTPLNGVLGAADLLASTPLSERQSELVELIRVSADAVKHLVGDILDLSRVQAGQLRLEPTRFAPAVALAGVFESARLQAREKGLSFHVEIEPDAAAACEGDPVRVRQILGHLLSNALKFTEAGEVRVRIARDAEGWLAITVADTGVGFDPTTAGQIFQLFTQADAGATRAVGGTGLGLSLCKALIELMGGAICVESEPGKGSRFHVRAPLPPFEEIDPPAPSRPHEGPDQPLRILVVEDNPTNRRVVELILEPCDVSLVMAENGQIGVEAWERGLFDLVLMDLQMPVMDGLSAIHEIRRREAAAGRGRTPIAVLSANAMEHHRQEAVEAGADLHLAKPITPHGLLDGIAEALSKAALAA
jgi:signal transduction histidine kinase/CheY-like chemotaxis protein